MILLFIRSVLSSGNVLHDGALYFRSLLNVRPITSRSSSIHSAIYTFVLPPILFLSSFMADLTTYPANDERIHIMGRHEVDSNGSIKFGASGVSFYFRFEGTTLEIELEDEFRYGNANNIFTVILNGEETHRFKIQPGQSRFTLANDLKSAEHELILVKTTEGANGWTRLKSIRTEKLLESKPLPNRYIEFIGDSITSGMAADERFVKCGEGDWMDQHNSWSSYGSIIARNLNAQFMLTSVSGMGMHRNWNAPAPVMPDRYESIFSDPADSLTKWDFSQFKADVVVIALGTNDFSDGDRPDPRPAPVADEFKSQYLNFLIAIRQKYPLARILMLNSPLIDPHRNELLTQWLIELKAERAAAGDPNVYVFEFKEQYPSGCSGHPNLVEHAAMAELLIPVVGSLLDR
jgi:hypothetical protein